MSDSPLLKAVVYRRRRNLYMHPYSLTTEGFWIFSEPVVAISTDDLHIAAYLLATLSKSISKIPHPRSWVGLMTPLLKEAGVRSFDTFAKDSKAVEVCREGNIITLTPTKNGGRGNAFSHLINKAIKSETQEVDLTKALSAAFEACED